MSITESMDLIQWFQCLSLGHVDGQVNTLEIVCKSANLVSKLRLRCPPVYTGSLIAMSCLSTEAYLL